MKANRIYQSYKEQIKAFADNFETNDRPKRRTALNDYLDYCVKDMANYYLLHEEISHKQYVLFTDWLTSYTIKRHEK